MGLPMGVENRKRPRLKTAIQVRFNLDSNYHFVPKIREKGIGGTVRNISSEGLGIESELDMLDMCQIFPESIEDGSVFGLELVFIDSERRKTLIKGEVSWHRMSQPQNDLWHFQAGLQPKDTKSRAVARRMFESISRTTKPPDEYENFLDLRDFQLAESTLRGSIKNTGDKTVNYLVIEAKCLDNQGKEIQRKLYRAVPCGRAKKKLKPGMVIRVAAGIREIPPLATDVEVNVHKLSLDQSTDA
jgi:hypothetical protein